MKPARMAALHRAGFTTPPPWSEEAFAHLLARSDTLLETVDDGFALVRVTLDEAELLTVTTIPDARRRGIAARLIARLLDRAADAGATACFLEVAADNMPALRLYHRVGFREVGKRPRYYRASDGTTRDALVLACDLPISHVTAQRRDPTAPESY
jgi:ribosomal-protein-alanine N-acetyltransferase